FFFFFISRSPPCSTLFPYTTLFRSLSACLGPVRCHVHLRTRDARGPRLVAGNRHRCARVSVLRFSLPFRLVPVSRNSPGQSHFHAAAVDALDRCRVHQLHLDSRWRLARLRGSQPQAIRSHQEPIRSASERHQYHRNPSLSAFGRLSLCPHCHGRFASRRRDRKSTRLNSSHVAISYAVFCLK